MKLTLDELKQYPIDVVSGKIIAGELVKLSCQQFLDMLEDDRFIFNIKKVNHVLNFISHLKHSDGKTAGKYFELSPVQIWFISRIFGFYWKAEPKKRVTRNALILVSRKFGKALDINELIPTPNGFVKMGDLKVGDYVFDANGKPTRIVNATEVMHNHDCYKVTFEDGSDVIADAEHNWYVKDHNRREKEGVLTTEEMYNRGLKRRRNDDKGTEYFFRIPMSKPVERPEQELKLDPYILGLWLGDGTRRKPEISTDIRDIEIYEKYVYPVIGKPKKIKENSKYGLHLIFTGDMEKKSILRGLLEDIGVLNDKHIPYQYLNASIAQRMALLQGLMDSDGYVGKNGSCEIQQKNTKIADGICELLSSLGIKYTRKTKIPTIDGKACNPVQRICFFTDKTRPCFRLERKYNNLKDNLNKRMLWKSITNIEKTESIPVRCIMVDNPEHLYLFGKNYNVTHNSSLVAALGLYMLLADGEGRAECYCAANSFKQAQILLNMTQRYAKSIDPKGKYLKQTRDSIVFKPNGAVFNCLAADASVQDGTSPSFIVVDELESAQNNDVLMTLKTGTGFRENPITFVISTAGFLIGEQYPLYAERKAAIEVLRGVKEDYSLFAALYELDEGDNPLEDETCWIKANPHMGITVTKDYLAQMVKEAKNNPSIATHVLTKNFNVFCKSVVTWVSDEYVLKNTKNITLYDIPKNTPYHIGIDLGSVDDLTAVAFMFDYQGKKHIFVKTYLPEETLKHHQNADHYKLWARQGFLTITPGNVCDYDYILKDLIEMRNKFPALRCIHYDSYNSTQFIINATERGFNCKPYSQSISSFNKPTKEFQRLLLSTNEVVLENNPIIRWCFQNVQIKSDGNGNSKPIKEQKDSANKIDLIIAILMAFGGYLQEPHTDMRIA